MKKLLKEKNIFVFFEISLILKGVFALFEIIGGLFFYFVSLQFIFTLAQVITHGELVEDPRDSIANYFLHSAQTFSISSSHFVALYLLLHGVIKLFLIAGLWRKKIWYYPASLIIFGLFMMYQFYRFSFTHAAFLLVLIALDFLVIVLTWHEYKIMRHRRG